MAEANISSPERSELNPLVKTAIKDFYLSFRFSQGSPTLQHQFFFYIARTHPPEVCSRLSALYSPPQLERMTVPKKHKRILSPRTEFTDAWEAQQAIFLMYGEPNERESNQPYNEFVYEITYLMIETDLRHVTKGRPNRKPTENSHESFIKRYAIDRQPTGSVLFDQLFRDISDTIAAEKQKGFPDDTWETLPEEESDKLSLPSLNTNLGSLVSRWEEKHPGQSFFPKSE